MAAAVAAILGSRADGATPAYPGAEGFGAVATGGRTDSVQVVTNFNSSGPGSFAKAVETANSTVVFNVGGYIDLKGEISVASNVTILGQTAPGGGIGLMDGELSFSGSSNDIVSYIRLRQGNGSSVDSNKSALEIDNASNIILNHDSIQFGQFDSADINSCNGVTIQSCIFSDAIGQQFGIHAQNTNNFTIVNSVFANDHNRNPFIENNGTMQMVDNVVYDVQAGFTSGSGGGTRQEDLVNNYFITGPSTTSNGDAAYFQVNGSDHMYQSGNYEDSNRDGTLNGSIVTAGGVTNESTAWTPTTALLPTVSASQAVAFDIAQAGASIVRDQLDTLDVSQLQTYGVNGGTGGGDHLYSQPADSGQSNGGYGTIANGTPPASTTNDGIPDSWATAHGMNVSNAAQAMALNPLGYTMVEAYANSLANATLTTRTWNSSGGVNWNTPAKWGGTLPGVFDIASVTGNGPGTDGSILLTPSSGAQNIYQLYIGGNGSTAGESVVVQLGTLTVSDNITIGNLNNGTLQINGGTVTAESVQLGNTLNGTTYTGTLDLTSGVLLTSNIVLGGGTPGNWTSGGNFNWSGGTLRINGTLNVNAPIILGSAGETLDTNAGTGTISGIISGTGSLNVIGGGTLTLSAANTYTGVTTISGATVNASPLTNAGAAGTLGASNNSAANLILDGGTLMGSGGTDRLFTLTAKGGTLDQSQAMYFSNTGAIALPQANVTLTLTGTNTGHETFSPTLADPGNGYVLSVLKTGTGKWTFNATGDKNYSGLTNVSAGTLESLATNAFSPDSTLFIAAGASVEMHGYNNAINGLQGAGGLYDSFGHAGDTLTIGSNNGGGTFTGNLGNGGLPDLIKNGSGTQILAGTDTYTGTTTVNGGVLQFNLAAAIGGTGVSVTVAGGATAAAGYAMDQTTFLDRITNTSTGTAALAVGDANNLNFSVSGANLPNVSLGAVGTATYTGTVTPYGSTYQFGGGGGTLILPNTNAASGANSVAISGPGTVVLSGNNSFTGSTVISGGTLQLGAGLALQNSTLNYNNQGGNLSFGSLTAATLGGLAGSQSLVLNNGSAAVALTVGNNNATTTYSGSLSGNGASVAKIGTGTWTLSGNNTYTGTTTVSAGILNVNGSLSALTVLNSSASVNFGPNTGAGILDRTFAGLNLSGGRMNVANSAIHTNRTLIVTSALTLGGGSQLDLGSNDAIVHGGNLANLTNEVAQGFSGGNWNGAAGILSSNAAADTTHLTALGVIQNSVNGSPAGAALYGSAGPSGLFDGVNPADTDVLIKYTYYGDANLDGEVDGTDYSRVDTAFLADRTQPNLDTGWYNGDFNYDGTVDGSDYTLIDNAFDVQGAQLTSAIATAQIAGASAVPEPMAGSMMGLAALGLLGRRRHRPSH